MLQAVVLAEIHVDVEVAAEGLKAETLAQQRALESPARHQWDLCSESFGRALRRHLVERVDLLTGTRPAVGLVVVRQIANESPELLLSQAPEDGDGST